MDKRKPNLISLFLPNLSMVLWMITFFFVLLIGRFMVNADGDLALHLNLGNYILETGTIPLRDIFSHTLTGEKVAQHEWLSTVIFQLINQSFGLPGVVLFCAVVIASTFYLLHKTLQNTTNSPMIALLVSSLAMISSMVHWVARPHIFSFLLLTYWIIVLGQLRMGSHQKWWILPVLMLFWVNLHGGFIIGFISWFIFGFGVAWDALLRRNPEDCKIPSHFWRYFLFGGLSSLGISLLNPSGIGLWSKVIQHLGNRYLADFTIEFRSPNFHNMITWPFLFYIALLIIVLSFSKKHIRSEKTFLGAAWLVMGLYSARNIPLSAIAAAPLLAEGLIDLFSRSSPKIKLLNKLSKLDNRLEQMEKQLKGFIWPAICLIIVVLGLSMGYRFDIEGQGYAFDPEFFPIEAVEWLKNHPQEGEMFNAYGWGGYLQYHLWPEKRVFIDSKADFYGEDFVREYEKVMELQTGWEKIVEQYNVIWAILPSDEPVAKALVNNLGWQLVYLDSTATILRK